MQTKRDLMWNLWREGYSFSSIGRAFGCSRQNVRQFCSQGRSDDEIRIAENQHNSNKDLKRGMTPVIPLSAQRRVYTKEDVLKFYSEGKSYKEIVELTGLHYCIVVSWIPTEMKQERKQKRVSTILELYRSGMRVTDIAKELGVSDITIYNVLHKCGEYHSWSKFDKSAIVEMYRNGASVRDISDKHGASSTSVYTILAEVDAVAERFESKKDRVYEVARLYNDGLSGPEIAKNLGVSATTVYKDLNLYYAEG